MLPFCLGGPAENALGERGREPRELVGATKKMERPRFTVLHPEGSYNATKDIVERLLMDNMQDEVFILQAVGPEQAAIRRALENIATRSRHMGQQLIECVQPAKKVPGGNRKSLSPQDGDARSVDRS